jgi:hypothetical protein
MSRARKLLFLNVGILVASFALWVAAALLGWLQSVVFVSHVSMLALVISAISGIAAGDAAVEAESD